MRCVMKTLEILPSPLEFCAPQPIYSNIRKSQWIFHESAIRGNGNPFFEHPPLPEDPALWETIVTEWISLSTPEGEALYHLVRYRLYTMKRTTNIHHASEGAIAFLALTRDNPEWGLLT
jgi:hypothetical protein